MKRFTGLLLALLMLTLPLAARADISESIMILVNKTHALPSDYEPSDLVQPDVEYAPDIDPSRKQMRAEAAHALEALFSAAREDGIELLAVSGYRSYETQEEIYNRRLEETDLDYVSRYVAEPGYSEHQTGLAMDLGCSGCCDLTEDFADTPAYRWLRKHAHEYGFIIRYPKNGERETGYAFEPWHIRYLGGQADAVYKSGLTFETWYAQTLDGLSLHRTFNFRLDTLFG